MKTNLKSGRKAKAKTVMSIWSQLQKDGQTKIQILSGLEDNYSSLSAFTDTSTLNKQSILLSGVKKNCVFMIESQKQLIIQCIKGQLLKVSIDIEEQKQDDPSQLRLDV